MTDVTILPVSPQTFWPLAAVVSFATLTALIYWVISSTGKAYRPPIWEEMREGWRGPTILLGLIWLGLFALTIAAAYVGVWQALHPEGEASQPNLGLGALLAALLGAPFVIWGTWLKYQTVRFQKEGHMTDRINKAVEQLGAEKTVKVRSKDADGKDVTIEETQPNIEVRIGAILSLERIAQDSTIHDKGRDHVRVMEILCAYVRENSNARKAETCLRQEYVRENDNWEDDPRQFDDWFCDEYNVNPPELEEAISVDALQRWAQGLKGPRVDVMQALQVIGRRTAEQRKVEAAWPDPPTEGTVWSFDVPCPHLPDKPGEAALSAPEIAGFKAGLTQWKALIADYKGYRLDLQGANLQGARLTSQRPHASDAVYSGALLTGARMEGAWFSGARMEGADLDGTKIDGANLFSARLEGASFSKAHMEGADLMQARMQGAEFLRAEMEKANLSSARMEGAILGRALLEGAQLSGARMEWADLSWAQMMRASLFAARMDKANLSSVRIDEAIGVTGAVFSGAAVRSVNWTDTDLTQGQVNSIFGDASVSLPKGVIRPANWPTWQLRSRGTNSFGSEWKKWLSDPKGYVPPSPQAEEQDGARPRGHWVLK